jgi:transposase InsO family protein
MSDGRPQYVSFAIKQFAQSYGFQHIVSSPRYAQSNGLAERGIQTIKMMLKKSDDPYIPLLSYRATSLANGHSPAELLMGRKLQTLLPIAPKQLKPELPNCRSLRENEKESKLKQIRNYDRRHRARLLTKVKTNDKVWIKDQKKSGTVKTESNEPRSYIIQTDSGEIRRNRRHLVKKFPNQ